MRYTIKFMEAYILVGHPAVPTILASSEFPSFQDAQRVVTNHYDATKPRPDMKLRWDVTPRGYVASDAETGSYFVETAA